MSPRHLALLAACAALAACGQREGSARHAVFAADQQASARASVALVSAPTAPKSAADFVAKAKGGDAFELQSAQLALQKGRSPEVKAYASMILRDHTRSEGELEKAVAAAGQPFNAAPVVSPDGQRALKQMASAEGADFDKTYMTAQVSAHQDALALMQDYAQNGDNPALTSFASQAASVVLGHYQQARTIASALS